MTSIAEHVRLCDMERQVDALVARMDGLYARLVDRELQLSALQERIQVLEEKRGPGRPSNASRELAA